MTGKRAVSISVKGQITRIIGQIALHLVGGFAHLAQRLLDVAARLEFEPHTGKAFGGLARHLVEPLDGSKLCFHRFEKQALGVARTDAVDASGDIDERQRHLRIGLLGDRDVGCGPDSEQHREDHQHHTGARKSGVDQRVH